MFGKNAPDDESTLDAAITDLERELVTYESADEGYHKTLLNLERLYKLKEKHGNKRFLERVSPDTVLLVGGNLLGIFVIMYHERAHVITTKAFSHILKPR